MFLISAKPYQHEQVQCRTETACKKEKPEDYWHVNYRRRQRNMDKGFYSTPWEPYRPIGGELVLDPYELVTSSLPGNMDRMVKQSSRLEGGSEDNSKIIVLFLIQNICCDPSSWQDGSNNVSQICFYGEIWLIIPKLYL